MPAMLNHSTDVLPPPAGIQRPVTSLMQCFGGGCFRYPGEPPCEHCGGKAVELPPEEPAAEADSTNVEEPDSDDVTVEETYRRWTAAAQAGVETLPTRKPKSQWIRARSKRMLDMIEGKIKELEAGARNKPGWRERSKQIKTAIRKSRAEDWWEHVNSIADALGKADEAGDFKLNLLI